MTEKSHTQKTIAIIGGGPAGLMAAEILATAGMAVTIYDHKPSVGRKFLMAGRGGLNLTHSEDFEPFMQRYGSAAPNRLPAIQNFTPTQLRQWCEDLGQETFIGSSGRVFPKSLKASPLLRAWLERLNALGVTINLNHHWTGWDNDALTFTTPQGPITVKPDATLLALGGGSWAKLGSDGSWTELLKNKGIPVAPLRPSNSGFTVQWSDILKTRFAGQPLKTVTLSYGNQTIPGDMMITETGIEGGPVYALSSALRNDLDAEKPATLHIDLKPGLTPDAIRQKLSTPRGGQSFSTYLQKSLGLPPISINLLRECAGDCSAMGPDKLARILKALPLTVSGTASIDRAISTSGGVTFDSIDENYMLKKLPGIFVAGEMLDWEAPTGGYLLQACFSTAVAAANGILKHLK
ncbi:MAG: NAD(FAD)-utilizing dehydrogenase [Micavibrio sp.]|nr:NAD(FAD)-utilizing dehydrogenase [Micavibrio sp.]